MPEFNGSQPFLSGVVIQSLLCQAYWYNDHLEAPAKIVFLQINDLWHRLYFDCGVIFWRDDGSDGLIFEDGRTDNGEFRTIDLADRFSLRGRTITDCVSETVNEDDAKVTFHLAGGGTLAFVDINDRTEIEPSGLPDRGRTYGVAKPSLHPLGSTWVRAARGIRRNAVVAAIRMHSRAPRNRN
jgi:hypothetical protein